MKSRRSMRRSKKKNSPRIMNRQIALYIASAVDPLKTFRSTMLIRSAAHRIARELALQFLKQHSFVQTMRSARIESAEAIVARNGDDWACRRLDIDVGGNSIRRLIKELRNPKAVVLPSLNLAEESDKSEEEEDSEVMINVKMDSDESVIRDAVVRELSSDKESITGCYVTRSSLSVTDPELSRQVIRPASDSYRSIDQDHDLCLFNVNDGDSDEEGNILLLLRQNAIFASSSSSQEEQRVSVDNMSVDITEEKIEILSLSSDDDSESRLKIQSVSRKMMTHSPILQDNGRHRKQWPRRSRTSHSSHMKNDSEGDEGTCAVLSLPDEESSDEISEEEEKLEAPSEKEVTDQYEQSVEPATGYKSNSDEERNTGFTVGDVVQKLRDSNSRSASDSSSFEADLRETKESVATLRKVVSQNLLSSRSDSTSQRSHSAGEKTLQEESHGSVVQVDDEEEEEEEEEDEFFHPIGNQHCDSHESRLSEGENRDDVAPNYGKEGSHIPGERSFNDQKESPVNRGKVDDSIEEEDVQNKGQIWLIGEEEETIVEPEIPHNEEEAIIEQEIPHNEEETIIEQEITHNEEEVIIEQEIPHNEEEAIIEKEIPHNEEETIIEQEIPKNEEVHHATDQKSLEKN